MGMGMGAADFLPLISREPNSGKLSIRQLSNNPVFGVKNIFKCTG